MNDKYISEHMVSCGEDFSFRLTDSCPFSVEFPTLEAAVSRLCEQMFGATLKLVPDETGSEKCLDDGGTCGLGGYCPECPHGDLPPPIPKRDQIMFHLDRLIHQHDDEPGRVDYHPDALWLEKVRHHITDLERQLAEARDENKKLVADLHLYESKSLCLHEENAKLIKDMILHEKMADGFMDERDEAQKQRDEWKAKYVKQNKDLGCELRDPNGTIWDEAKRLKGENEVFAALRNDLVKVLKDADNVIEDIGFASHGHIRTKIHKALSSLKP